ncbi:rCG24556 [Rattus norvegicus]|uniref:RCG24556 n=1 Tax=Rattus norvegicus TaxID=10116 RepID=A6JBM6_RAT|nr:rCG24556 [Rattus norvegicus]
MWIGDRWASAKIPAPCVLEKRLSHVHVVNNSIRD